MAFAYVFTVLRRRWVTVVAGVVLGVIVGAVFALQTPTRYSATTSIVVSPVVSNPFTDSREEVNIRTEREILASREVAERASETLGVPLDPDSYLMSQVDIAAPSGSQILQVTVQAGAPQQAADAADALSEAYLEFRREGADETADRYLEKVDQQLAELQEQSETEVNEGLIETLQQQRLTLVLTSAEPGRVIGRATPPSSPSSPGLQMYLPGGLVGGALLGVGAAILRERLDRRVRTADRLEQVVSPSAVVQGRLDDGEFWESLADESLRHAGPEVDPARMGVLIRALDPVGSGGVEQSFRSGLDEVLRDIDVVPPTASERDAEAGGANLADRPHYGRRASGAATAAPEEQRVSIISNGASHARVTRAARRSDVALVLLSPRTLLKETSDLLTILRGTGLDVVVGLAEHAEGQVGDADIEEEKR